MIRLRRHVPLLAAAIFWLLSVVVGAPAFASVESWPEGQEAFEGAVGRDAPTLAPTVNRRDCSAAPTVNRRDCSAAPTANRRDCSAAPTANRRDCSAAPKAGAGGGPKLIGPAGDAASRGGAVGVKPPSTPFGGSVESLRSGQGPWKLQSAHAEGATGRAYKGATSIEEVFKNTQTGETIVRHRIVRGDEMLHETFRPYAKFGVP
jgi:hypothetical protein